MEEILLFPVADESECKLPVMLLRSDKEREKIMYVYNLRDLGDSSVFFKLTYQRVSRKPLLFWRGKDPKLTRLTGSTQ